MKKKLVAWIMTGLMLLGVGATTAQAASAAEQKIGAFQKVESQEQEVSGLRATSGKPVLVGTYNGAQGIGIKWVQVSGATSYDIYRKYQGRWSRLKTVSAWDSSLQRSGVTLMYTDTTVKTKYGSGYIYSVAATVGGRSTGYNTTGLAAYRLKNPTITKVWKSGTRTYMTWSKVPCTGYEIQVASASNTLRWESYSPNPRNATSGYFARSLWPFGAGKYYIRMRCYKTNADRGTTFSEYSAWKSVTIY